MAKIIRVLLIIVISVTASAATTVSLMLHYSKPLGVGIVKSNGITFEHAYSEEESVEPTKQTAKHLIRPQENSVEKGEYLQSLPDAPRYFDYALLSRDIAVFSEKVSRFNGVLSHEIQRLKNESSRGKTSP